MATMLEHDPHDVVMSVWNVVEAQFAKWRVGWVALVAFLIALVVEYIFGHGIGDPTIWTILAISIYARRHYLLRDLKWGWLGFLPYAFFFSLNVWVHRNMARPGDVYENLGQREEGSFQWVPYDAAQNGTQPLDIQNKFAITLRPDARMKVRPSHSITRAGGYVVQLDGEATVDVRSIADHVTIVGATSATTAVLLPGTYEVRGWLKGDSLRVVRVAGDSAVAVRGGARVVESTGRRP